MRTISRTLEIKWDKVNWSDETAYLEECSGDAILTAEGSTLVGGAQANSAQIVLNNSTKRFSAGYVSGPLYAYIKEGRTRTVPVRLKIGVNGAQEFIFTGTIDEWDEDTKRHITTLKCLDPSHLLIDTALSTALYLSVRTDQYISTLLTLIGVSATVDIGFYYLPFAWMDDENIFQELKSVVAAEGGRMYYGAQGTLYIENAAHWLHHTTNQHTFTVDSFGACMVGYDWQGFANQIYVEYTPRAESCSQRIWSASEQYMIKPGETRTIECRTMNPVVAVHDLVIGEDIIAVSSSGVSMDAKLSWSLADTKAQMLTYELTNADANYAIFIIHFDVRGIPIYGKLSRKVSAKNQASIDQWGTVARTVPVNIYVQSEAHAQSLANMMCDKLSTPRLCFRLNGMPGITGLKLGDRVTLVEAHSGINKSCFITRLSWKLIDKFTMDIDTVEAGLFQISDYFKWGTSKYGNASQAEHGHLWY